MTAIKEFCREFFYGTDERGIRGRYIMLIIDTGIVLYFVITTFLPYQDWIKYTDAAIGVFMVIELTGRIIADSDKMGLLSRPLALLDIAIIVSLFVPLFMDLDVGSLSFLRIVRAMRVLRSYSVTSKLKRQFSFFARNEEVIFSALNLMIFIFIVTAFVYVLQKDDNEGIQNYVDALYFTIATLTTTGFGDVTLTGNDGKLLSILIMIVGVALFIRLVQTIFKPNKIRYECPQCSLTRHDLDAVHCKHCGHELHIRTEGVY